MYLLRKTDAICANFSFIFYPVGILLLAGKTLRRYVIVGQNITRPSLFVDPCTCKRGFSDEGVATKKIYGERRGQCY